MLPLTIPLPPVDSAARHPWNRHALTPWRTMFRMVALRQAALVAPIVFFGCLEVNGIVVKFDTITGIACAG
jgi:hypothetical protein